VFCNSDLKLKTKKEAGIDLIATKKLQKIIYVTVVSKMSLVK